MSEQPRAPGALILAAIVLEPVAGLVCAALAAALVALLWTGALDSRPERLFGGALAAALALCAWRLGTGPARLRESGGRRSEALLGLAAALVVLAAGGYLLAYAGAVLEELRRLL